MNVSDIALKLMLASYSSGHEMTSAKAFVAAEIFIAERDKRCGKVVDTLIKNNLQDGSGWNTYPEVRSRSDAPVLVQYCDGRYGVESAVTDRGAWFFKSLVPVVRWQSIKE